VAFLAVAPTTGLRVEAPPRLGKVRVIDKPGWTAKLERDRHGRLVAIDWSGGQFAPHQPDGFDISARLPPKPAVLTFTATQFCGDVVVRWDEPVSPGAPRPEHPVPTLTVGDAPPVAALPPAQMPPGVQFLQGALADAAGRPLYVFEYDTMAGMSHCVEQCAATWPPLAAPRKASPVGAFTVIARDDGGWQWAYRDKPLYTYSADVPGGAPKGVDQPHWSLAR
jgi:YD repeat-containing protein